MDENTLNRIESKIDRLDIRIDGIDMALALQGQLLEEHQRRSLANEELINIVEDKFSKDLAPIKEHVAMFAGAFKALIVIGSILGAVAGLLKLFGKA